jgi:hypothetical protein
MAIALEAYTAVGRLDGRVVAAPRLSELLDTLTSIVVEGPQLTPNPGSVGSSASYVAPGTPWTSAEVDDLLVVAAPPETVVPYHAAWHRVRLHATPYVIEGELPSLPGFDPGRALTRPTGSFVMLARVRIVLARDVPLEDELDPVAQVPGLALRELPYAWINRYAVERCESDLELSRFFPGAGVAVMAREPVPTFR